MRSWVSKGKMEYKNGAILINIEIFYVGGENRCISRIVHELTHFVNDNEGGIPVLYRTENKIYENLSYYLRGTECNARCSEFGSFLKNEEQIKPLKEYEDITCLKRIKTFLDEGERIPVNGIKRFQRKFGEYRRRIFKIYSGFQVQ